MAGHRPGHLRFCPLGYQDRERENFRSDCGYNCALKISSTFQYFNVPLDHHWSNGGFSATRGNATSWQDSPCLLA
jgi:hypothetical protein